MRFFKCVAFFWQRNKKKIKGSDNELHIDKASLKHTDIKIHGHHNVITIDKNASLKNCRISIKGDYHRLHIAESATLYGCELKFEDHHCVITIGSRTKILKNSYLSAAEPHSKIEIGSDCLISTDFHARNTDSHSILDLATGKRINFGKNITLGNHIWIGGHVQILKGVTVQDHCIIGMRSLVTKNISANTLVAGVPATVIKSNIDWCEERLSE